MSYRGRSKSNYGVIRRSSHSFGKRRKPTISERLDIIRREKTKPSIMDIPSKPANNLIIPTNVFYSNEDLHKDYPLGSFAVYVEDKYFVSNRWQEQRKKPIYHVIEVTDKSPIGRVGTVTPFGKIVSSHQAFNAEDNEKFKKRAIDEAIKLNEAFFKKVIQKQARIKGISERKERLVAEKNRGQSQLF